METITEKELATLSVNGTKVYVFENPDFLPKYLDVCPNGNWAVEITLDNCKEYVIKNGYKPILYPLDYLTKPITHNGETFVPCDELEYVVSESIVSYVKNRFEIVEYWRVQKLLEWRFDVFNLINRGLAIPITETFNPYN